MGRVFYFGDLTTHCNLSKWVFMRFWISRVMFPQWQIYRVFVLTHWGRVINMCVSNLNTIGSDNGLSPDRRQAIIWSNAGILLTGPLGTNLSEISIETLTFSFKKRHLKVSSAKWQPLCLGLNVLNATSPVSLMQGHHLISKANNTQNEIYAVFIREKEMSWKLISGSHKPWWNTPVI